VSPSLVEGSQPKRVRGEAESLLTIQHLHKVKTKALRRKIWFKALSKVERSIVDLTIRFVGKIRSQTLAEIILTILSKLFRALGEGYLHQAEKIGHEIAERICRVALKWGNLQAKTWKHDRNFVRFLGVNALNT